MVLQLTDQEIIKIDKLMQMHHEGHQVSGDFSSFVCDDECRQIALGYTINKVLREKQE